MGRSQETTRAVTYKIRIVPTALKMLKDIPDQRIQGKIVDCINKLANEPEKQGKPLWDELKGFRSIRAIGQRYRIIYKIEKGIIIVVVVAVGIRKEGDRKDIYELAKKLVRLGLA